MATSVHSSDNETLNHEEEAQSHPPAAPNVGESNERVAAMVKAHLPFVWRTLRRRGLDASEADDAAQQVFLIVHRKIDSVIEGAEKAFLFRTAELVAHDVHRARKRNMARTDDETDADTLSAEGDYSPEDLADRTRARAILDELLSKLSAERRSVFVLYELEGMEVQEIAAMMETPIGTVASRLRRARVDFERELTRFKAKAQAKSQAKRPGGGASTKT